MRRGSLATLFTAINAGLVLVAVIGVAVGAVRVLRQLADRQALARVDLAASSAATAIERSGDRLLAAARLEAEQASVAGWAMAADRRRLHLWLERVRRASDLTGCALFLDGTLVASAGRPLPWADLRQASGGRSLAGTASGEVILGA